MIRHDFKTIQHTLYGCAKKTCLQKNVKTFSYIYGIDRSGDRLVYRGWYTDSWHEAETWSGTV